MKEYRITERLNTLNDILTIQSEKIYMIEQKHSFLCMSWWSKKHVTDFDGDYTIMQYHKKEDAKHSVEFLKNGGTGKNPLTDLHYQIDFEYWHSRHLGDNYPYNDCRKRGIESFKKNLPKYSLKNLDKAGMININLEL